MLCADDYGMSPGVSRGILRLAEAGRVSATSAMANAPDWPRFAGDLHAVASRIGIGLHLTLTYGAPLGPMPRFAPDGRLPPLGRLIRAAFAGRLPTDEIATEIRRQLDAFRAALGREPDFADGHQHVHVLPGIREPLLAAIAEFGPPPGFWLRDPGERLAAILRRPSAPKAAFVAVLASGLSRAAARRGIAVNRGFSGFSEFRPDQDLARDFDAYLDGVGPAHVVMCHPGEVAPGEALDGVTEPRRRELDHLLSPAFGELLERRRVALVPAPRALS
ncbi:MAG: ChbG/HpnK family deacetylase [Methylobacteriaceae bacterium]|nr:ChbG/HpnK family deacetylase [Methylobacteriaceae bacterium]